MVAAPLADGVTGLAAQLAALTLDATDARPEAPVAILNPADDDAAVSQEGLTDWPLIVVASEQPSRLTMVGVSQPVRLDVLSHTVTVAYVSRDGVDPSQAWRDADYTLRAALKALVVGLFAHDKESARTRGPVAILKLNGADIVQTEHRIPGGVVYGALMLDLHLRFIP